MFLGQASAGGAGAWATMLLPLVVFSFNVFHDHETAEKGTAESEIHVIFYGSGRQCGNHKRFYGILIDITDEDVIVEFVTTETAEFP